MAWSATPGHQVNSYRNTYNETADLSRIDPDPLSVFLAILGAVGSFVSIAAYIEYKIEQRIQEREQEEKTRRELTDTLSASFRPDLTPG